MSMTGVIRPGHCSLRVLDMEAAVKHYTEVVGLLETDRDEKGRVYLKAWDEQDHHSIILREADIPGADYIAFKSITFLPASSKRPVSGFDLRFRPATMSNSMRKRNGSGTEWATSTPPRGLTASKGCSRHAWTTGKFTAWTLMAR